MPDLAAMGATLRRWREQPLVFVRDNFGVEPDAWQAEALTAFASPDATMRRISLQACVGPGKTSVLAWCGLHFLGTQGERGEHPKGAAVAITFDNLKDNLWPEFSKWMGRSRYLSSAFTWNQSRIFAKDHPETWFLSARSWPKSANADEQGKTLSGLHSKYVLALIDESGAIPLTVLRAAEQALSNCAFGKIVQAGNPISRDGMLYAAASSLRHLWHVIRITGDPDDPRRSPRIDLEWAKGQIAIYGRDNPWVGSYILGQFPTQAFNALLTVEEVEAAMQRRLREDAYSWSQKRLGIDVARFGDDRTVIFPRQGLASFKPIVMRVVRTTDIAARAAQAIANWGADLTLVDDTGHWGHGVVDNLFAAGCRVTPVVLSDPALAPRYRNRRAECWLEMAEWVKRGGALPNLPELVAELVTPTYTFVNGRFALEEKDQVKKRLGRSPDLGDALALTFAIADMPASLSHGNRGVGKALTDRGPLDDWRGQ
jgi:phage terminase large subunit